MKRRIPAFAGTSLTRRDGRRRLVVRWGDDPPEIYDSDYPDGEGLMILASIDIA